MLKKTAFTVIIYVFISFLIFINAQAKSYLKQGKDIDVCLWLRYDKEQDPYIGSVLCYKGSNINILSVCTGPLCHLSLCSNQVEVLSHLFFLKLNQVIFGGVAK